MKTHTFAGGIHPPEKKELSESFPIERISSLPKFITIPVTMGGAQNTPLVKPGDEVARGQLLSSGEHPLCVPVHSSVAGTVKKIETRVLTGGAESLCFIIEPNGSDKTDFLRPVDPFLCGRDEALARVREAGIVGMGGAAFPAHIKLKAPADKPIEFVLINGAECEPYLTIDCRVMEECTQKLIDGTAIIMQITGAHAGFIVTESNKLGLVPALEKAIQEAGYADKISVAVCETKYPQGGEKSITKAVLNREIPSGGLPCDVGCVIQNVGTACAVSDAFREGKPLIERPLTVSGGGCETPKNIVVPIGVTVSDLITLGVIKVSGSAEKIISGGPMMGFAMANTDFPIVKNTSGVLFLTRKESLAFAEGPCLGCARCVKACPSRLTPVMMQRSIDSGDLEKANTFGLLDCIECGSCAYVCPAHIKLVQRFKVGKVDLREARRAAAEQKKGA